MKKYQFKVVMTNNEAFEVSAMSETYEEALNQIDCIDFLQMVQGVEDIKQIELISEETCERSTEKEGRYFLFPDAKPLWYNLYDAENSVKIRFQHEDFNGTHQEIVFLGSTLTFVHLEAVLEQAAEWLMHYHPDKI